jgi:hypothetical protein
VGVNETFLLVTFFRGVLQPSRDRTALRELHVMQRVRGVRLSSQFEEIVRAFDFRFAPFFLVHRRFLMQMRFGTRGRVAATSGIGGLHRQPEFLRLVHARHDLLERQPPTVGDALPIAQVHQFLEGFGVIGRIVAIRILAIHVTAVRLHGRTRWRRWRRGRLAAALRATTGVIVATHRAERIEPNRVDGAPVRLEFQFWVGVEARCDPSRALLLNVNQFVCEQLRVLGKAEIRELRSDMHVVSSRERSRTELEGLGTDLQAQVGKHLDVGEVMIEKRQRPRQPALRFTVVAPPERFGRRSAPLPFLASHASLLETMNSKREGEHPPSRMV